LNKAELTKKSKAELESIAKQNGLSKTSNLNKTQLIDWILLKKREKPGKSSYLTLGILIISILSFCYQIKPEKKLCSVDQLQVFDNDTNFNILMIDILSLGTCNSYKECEIYISQKVSDINQISHIQIDQRIVNCSKQDLNLYSDSTIQKLLQDLNCDMLISGMIEQTNNNIQLVIDYSLRDKLKSKWFVYDNKTIHSDTTFFSLIENNNFNTITDAINWSIITKILSRDSIDTATLRKHLNSISPANKRSYSNAKVLEFMSFISEGEYDKAGKSITEAISRDTLNPYCYYYRFSHDLISSNYKQAKHDIYTYHILSQYNFHPDSTFVIDELLNTIDHELALSLIITKLHEMDLPQLLREHVKLYYDEFGYESLRKIVGSERLNKIESKIESNIR